MVKHFCDRCGKELVSARKYHVDWGTSMFKDYGFRDHSACLCKECYAEFEYFWYKRKPENKEESDEKKAKTDSPRPNP